MAYLIDSLIGATTEMDGHRVIARPIRGPFISRLRDAWLVLIGQADAVRFYGQ